MYDSSIADNWKAMVTFQQLIVMCQKGGIVDVTPRSISARTRIPEEIILEGLKILAEADPDSRSKAEDGRRIVPLLDEDGRERPWGWKIVNYDKYALTMDDEDRRRYKTAKQREYRAIEKSLQSPQNVHGGQSGHKKIRLDEDVEERSREGVAPAPSGKKKPGAGRPESVEEVKTYWSEKSLKGDPLQFYDHYDANGWMMGKAHIKSWSAAARNWSRNEATFGPPKPPPTGNPPKATGSTDAEFDFQNRKRWRMEADMKKRFALRDSGLPIEKIKGEMDKYQLDLDKKYGTDTTEFTA